jgi:hypothetical protein
MFVCVAVAVAVAVAEKAAVAVEITPTIYILQLVVSNTDFEGGTWEPNLGGVRGTWEP